MISPSLISFWTGLCCMNKGQKVNESMKDKLSNALITSFPMEERHAEILIKHYGYSAFPIAYELYRQGFIFTDLDAMPLKDALNKNSKFRKVVNKVLIKYNNSFDK